MHNTKKSILGIGIGIGLVAVSHATGLITLPSSITTLFPNYASTTNSIHFNRGGNDFQGAIMWGNPQTLNTAQTVTYGVDTLSCTQRVTGIYYNDQRGAKRWPLDDATRTSLAAINSDYNNIQNTGGLFTHCTGTGATLTAVYGQLTHILTGALSGEYKLKAGLSYNFTDNNYNATGFDTSLTGGINNQSSGYLYDSAGGIGLLSGTTQIIVTPPITGTNGNGGGGGGGGGGSLNVDKCPDGDFSKSYYDGTCGTKKSVEVIIEQPKGNACAYNDEQYINKGPFNDTLNHRGLPYIEVLRISCLSRGVATQKGGRLYAPEQSVTRAEVLKVVAKTIGIAFEDLIITDEDKAYTGDTPFADVPANHWFAHYADYMYKNGMLDGLVTTDKDEKKYLHPDQTMERYEAIKVIMMAYKKINPNTINIQGQSVMGDVIDKNNPYYGYIREAESLGFVSGIPQENGSYNFAGQNKITRAEFAKIVGVPFMQQLFDIEDVARNSNLYTMIQEAVNKTQSNKLAFVNSVFQSLSSIDDKSFLKSFKIDKTIFLDTLYRYIVTPLLVNESEDNAGYTEKQIQKLAQCLTDKKIVIYGTDRSPHYKEQKEMFGGSADLITSIDCDANRIQCQDVGVQAFPTWITSDGQKYAGDQTLDFLAQISACEL